MGAFVSEPTVWRSKSPAFRPDSVRPFQNSYFARNHHSSSEFGFQLANLPVATTVAIGTALMVVRLVGGDLLERLTGRFAFLAPGCGLGYSDKAVPSFVFAVKSEQNPTCP